MFKTNNMQGFGVNTSKVDIINVNQTNQPYQVKFHAINKYYSIDGRNMEFLLNDLDIETRGSNMFCPFHDDAGKPSAKYHPDSDRVYCFTESKVFSAYHVLKELYGKDMELEFKMVWSKLSTEDKEDLCRKFGGQVEVSSREHLSKVWLSLYNVLFCFKKQSVSFEQHKNALYKVLCMTYDIK